MTAFAFDASRAFGGTERLFGPGTLSRLAHLRISVIGIGGVGSWAAEALVRAGVGRLRLIDLDHVAESNLNRQIHATVDTLGQTKVHAMRERLLRIHPEAEIEAVDAFAEVGNLAALLSDVDGVIDAIDQVQVKVALIEHCRAIGLPLVVCGGAGGKTDAARLRVVDLADTEQDALIAKTRKRLRRLAAGRLVPKRRGPFKIPCVSSDEPARGQDETQDAAGLACAGYGSLVTVTACIGMIAAGELLRVLLARPVAEAAAPALPLNSQID